MSSLNWIGCFLGGDCDKIILSVNINDMKISTVFLVVAAVTLASIGALGDTIKWNKGASGTYYWHDAANWDLGRVPQDGDDVQLASSWDGYSYNNCYLTNSTANLKSLTLGRRRRLVVTGWSTCISAETVTLQGGGTPAATTDACIYAPAFANGAMSNRIWIVANKMTIYGGSSSGYLYALGYSSKAGPCWDGVASPSGGGSHGGYSYGRKGQLYGSITEPTAPGSGGDKYGSGGAIRLEVKELVNNGTIFATYGGGDSDNEGSRGSGGSIWITCDTLTGSGFIGAEGGGHHFTGNPTKYSNGSGGGGGRIAVDYDVEKQKTVTCQVSISARGGVDKGGSANARHEACGWCGTVWLKDDQFLKRPGMKLGGVIYTGDTPTRLTAAAFSEYLAENHALTNCYFEFTGDAERLDCPGDLSFTGSKTEVAPHLCGIATRANGLRFSGLRPSVAIAGDLSLEHAWVKFDNGRDFHVAGDLIQTAASYAVQSADLFVTAAPTNETTSATGARVSVDGTWTIGAYSSYIPDCSSTNGAIVLATTKHFLLQTNGEVNADGRGWGGNKGPGRPTGSLGSASYGGKGGALSASYSDQVGKVYGNIRKPVDPGSGSTGSSGGARGGGAIVMEVTGKAVIDGKISAAGKDGGANTSASSGGGVLLTVNNLQTSSGSISATGGVPGSSSRGGCGGGGRVAIYYHVNNAGDTFKNQVTAKGGVYTASSVDDSYNGQDGSVYWHRFGGMVIIVR